VDRDQALPTENLFRAISPELASSKVHAGTNGDPPTLSGHFAVFDQWARIDSAREGLFMERIAPGAFGESFARETPKIMFQHGRDPQIGEKVIAAPATVMEDARGAHYTAPLLDGVPEMLVDGLRKGAYGASFRFSVETDDLVRHPAVSAHNPEGLPERTITRANVPEAGPVTWGAYAGATAVVRSVTDEFRPLTVDEEIADLVRDKPGELAKLIQRALNMTDAPGNLHLKPSTEDGPAEETPQPAVITEPEPKLEPGTARNLSKEDEVAELETDYRTTEQKVARVVELDSEMTAIGNESTGVLTAEAQSRWDAAKEEVIRLNADIAAHEERQAWLKDRAPTDTKIRGEEDKPVPFTPIRKPENIYDKAAVYRDSRTPEHASQLFRENAMRAVEGAVFPHERANQEDAKGHVAQLLAHDTRDGEIAKRILTTGSPTYKRAFGKMLVAGTLDVLTSEERAVMAEGAGATGGFAITFELDPTIVKTSNGAVNPYRRVCRVVSISGTNEWRGVSSGAVVATYEAESTAAVDRSPTLAQPAFLAKRAQTLIDFSIELQQDWPQLQAEMAGLIQDSKDTLEAAQFATGVGTTVFPQGITVGFTNTATTGTTTVLAVNDIYKTEEALAPRFRPNAQWFANRFIYNKIRQLDTAGGANLWVPDLRTGIPNNETGNTGYNLIGYPANESSGLAASLATTTKLAVLFDPSYFVIVERVGMDIELIPHLFDATTNYPTGRRAIYAMWRNTGRVFDIAGGVTLVGL
jgi:HK97 family phage major capsid protein